MSRYIFLFCFILMMFFCTAIVKGQRTSFIYLQSQGAVSFFVNYKQQRFYSSASGYLIISKVSENDVALIIGFPGKPEADFLFRISMAEGDKGYLLRSTGENQWNLFDYQQATILDPEKTENKKIASTSSLEPDGFTNMLAGATKDSSVRYALPVKETVLSTKSDTNTNNTISVNKVPSMEKANSTVSTSKMPDKEQKNNNPTDVHKQSNEKIKSGQETVQQVKLGQKGKEEQLLFLVRNKNGRTDTVDVAFLPREEKTNEDRSSIEEIKDKGSATILTATDSSLKEKVEIEQEKPKATDNQASAAILKKPDSVSNNIIIQTVEGETKPTLDSVTTSVIDKAEELVVSNKNNVSVTTKLQKDSTTEKTEVQEVLKVVPKNNCRKAATEEEFIKLRRKMAQRFKDDEMLEEAQKVFRLVCFTTEQIRNLSVLFLTEEGKYRLFDVSLKSVLDMEHFRSLEASLQTSYFKKRFLALLPE